MTAALPSADMKKRLSPSRASAASLSPDAATSSRIFSGVGQSMRSFAGRSQSTRKAASSVKEAPAAARRKRGAPSVKVKVHHISPRNPTVRYEKKPHQSAAQAAARIAALHAGPGFEKNESR